jgi:hypothetical protein
LQQIHLGFVKTSKVRHRKAFAAIWKDSGWCDLLRLAAIWPQAHNRLLKQTAEPGVVDV